MIADKTYPSVLWDYSDTWNHDLRNLFRSAFDALLLKISSQSDLVLNTIGGSEVLPQDRPNAGHRSNA